MSADNGYLMRQLPNKRWVAQYINMSADWEEGGQPTPLTGKESEYSSLEYAIGSIKDGLSDTEYGIVAIFYDGMIPLQAVEDESVQVPLESPFKLIRRENPVDMATLLKVYEALHSQGIRGNQAINVIKAIDKLGVMFVEKR